MGKRGPRRSDEQKEYCLARVSELMLSSYSQQQMADIISKELGFNITRRQIGYDLQEVRQTYAAVPKENMEQYVNIELARINRLEREAWDAWERSLTPLQRREVDTWDENQREKSVETTSHGNAKFLSIIHQLQQERRKLLNIYPAVQMVHQVHKKIDIKSYVGVSPDDWDLHLLKEKTDVVVDVESE